MAASVFRYRVRDRMEAVCAIRVSGIFRLVFDGIVLLQPGLSSRKTINSIPELSSLHSVRSRGHGGSIAEFYTMLRIPKYPVHSTYGPCVVALHTSYKISQLHSH